MKLIYSIFLLSLLLFFVSCINKPTESKTGIIYVSVIDNNPAETPVPDVEITITPGDIIKKTNANGIASFEVDPGDYYIDADVCCVGPGYIHYHEPITVADDETVEVELLACLICL